MVLGKRLNSKTVFPLRLLQNESVRGAVGRHISRCGALTMTNRHSQIWATDAAQALGDYGLQVLRRAR